MAPILLMAFVSSLCAGLVGAQQTGQNIILGFNDSSYTVDEGATVMLRVLLSDVATSDITFDVITQDGSAVAPGDYDSIDFTVTVPTGNSEQQIHIPVKADNITENVEHFMVELRNPSNGIAIMNSMATVNIIDLDDARVGFNPTVYNIVEENFGELNFIIELFTPTERQLMIVINITSGTAELNEDYTAFDTTRITISSGATAGEKFITSVFLVGDNVFEPTEFFTASINSSPAERLFAVDDREVATANILDDDGITLGFDRTEYSVMESASSVAITVRLISGEMTGDIIVTMTTVDVTASSSVEPDFVAQSMNITISSANIEETVTIGVIDDTTLEHSEQFNCTLTLVSPNIPSIQLSPSVATVIIIDNDNVVIGFNQTVYDVSESAPLVTVYIELTSGSLQREVIVNISTMEDTALSGSDYIYLQWQQLTFDMNTLTVDIDINIINNEEFEAEEQFFVRLSSLDSAVMLSPLQTTVRIQDDDVITFAFRQQMYTFLESADSAVVCVDKNGTTELTVAMTMTGSLQTETAVENTLVFLPNGTSVCVTFNITDDNVALETPEVFTFELIQSENPLLRVQINSTRVVILDDDEVVVGFNPTVYNVSESAGVVTLMIERRGAVAQPFRVTITTADGTTSENINEVASELTFSPSLEETVVQDFTISVMDDMMVESTEQVILFLNTSHVSVVVEAGAEVATVNIINDDGFLYEIGFQMMEYTTSESSANFIAFIAINGNVSSSFSITVQAQDGTAKSGEDFQVISTQLTVAPGSTTIPVNVAIFNNSDTISFKNFSLVLSSEESIVRITTETTRVYIYDDDFPPPTIETMGPANIIDGQPTTFVCIVTASSDNITAHWINENGDIISNGSSTSPEEYSVDKELLRGSGADNSSQFVSRLSTTSFSLSTHLRQPLTCVGRVGNVVFERVAMKNVPDPIVQLRAPNVFLSIFPGEITLGQNLSVTCTSSTSYGLRPDNISVTPNIMWEVSYLLDGELVSNFFNATDLMNLTMGVFTSELFYSPVLVAINFTCSSYLSFSSDIVTDSEASQNFSKVIPQEPSLNVTLAVEPQIVADVTPYNNFTLTCSAMIPYDLLPLQLSFTIHDLNQSNIIAQSMSYSTFQDCEMITDSRVCTFIVDDSVQQNDLAGFREFVCSVQLFSSALLGSPPVQRPITIKQAEYIEFLTVNVPSFPAAVTNPHVDSVSHNLAIIYWTVSHLTYTPETYYIQYTRIGGQSENTQIYTSPTIVGTTDLTAMSVEYNIVLRGLENGTTYVASIVSNNTFRGRLSDDIFFTTNDFDIFPIMPAVDSTAPLGASIEFIFNISDESSNSINVSTPLTFIALFHTPLTQPSQILYDAGLNSVIVSYDHATPSLTGEYILCREAPISTTGRRKRGGLLPENEIPHLCSDVVVINVTIPTLSVSTNLLVQRYTEFDGVFFIEGGSPTVKCSPSDPRAPVQWSPNVSDIDPAYQVRFSPPGKEHTLTFPSVYESEPPSATVYFSCDLIDQELSEIAYPPLIVTLKFIQSEIAILNADNELTPNAVINNFAQPSFFLPCLGVSGHRNLTWETQLRTSIPYVESLSEMNDERLPPVYQSDYLGALRLYINPISINTAGYYYCRSQESGFVAEVLTTLTDPYWKLITPAINYLPVGGHFSFMLVQFADNSTGYQNFGAGFSYTTMFSPLFANNKTQSVVILESGLTFESPGNEYSYRRSTRLNEQDGIYQINATHIESGAEYIASVEVQITIPHFIGVDRSVFSHIGDLLTLSCQPNDTVATVIWLGRDSEGKMEVLTRSSSQVFTFTPSNLNHLVIFNATQYVSDNFGQDTLSEFQFELTCSFINGEDVSDLISPINITVLLQEEQIRMSLGSSRNSFVSNNTIINTITSSSDNEQGLSSGSLETSESLMPTPINGVEVPALIVECTATQGDHLPLWMMPFSSAENGLSQQYVENYTARLELFNLSGTSVGEYTCYSQFSGRHTRFFLTQENPYVRVVSSSEFSVMAGESVTLEFTVALNSDGVSRNTDDVVFTFSNFNNEQSLAISNFQIADQNLPHNFVYTIERVNQSHAGVYTARAPRQNCEIEREDCGEVTASITLNVTAYCPEEFNGGLIWPRTLSDTSVSLPCRRADPLFEVRTKTTRYCDIDGVWSQLDLSTCTLVEESLTFLLVWFVLEAPPEGITDEELEREMTALLNNQSVEYTNISLELIRDSMNTGTPVRVEITLLSDQQADEVSRIFQFFTFIGVYAISEVNRGFNLVIPSTTCACTPSNSTSIELCSGYSISPCNCTLASDCQCQYPYVGDGIHCTVDSDGDGYPDIALISPICSSPERMSLKYCKTDSCPTVANPGQNSQDCQPVNNNFPGCRYEMDDTWGVSWPNTPLGSTTTQVCPGGIDGTVGTTARFCDSDGEWGEPDVLQCTSVVFIELEDLAEVTLNILDPESQVLGAAILTERLIDATKPQEKPLLPNDLGASARIVTVVVEILENNNSSDENIIEVFNNVLDDNNREGWRILQSAGLVTSSELLLNSAERYGMVMAMSVNVSEGDQGVQTMRQSRQNIVVVGEQYREPPAIDLQFPLPGDLVNYTISRKSSTITIPSSLVREQLGKLRNSDNVPVFFILLRNLPMGLFVVNTSTRAVSDTPCIGRNFTTQGASDVLAAQVGSGSNNISFSGSPQGSPSVRLNFTFESNNASSLDTYSCVFWNFSDPIGNGSWMTAGVTNQDIMTQNTDAGNFTTVRCSSTHLTSFAVLVDVAGGLQVISEAEQVALQVVSYVGCAISIICLVVTVFFFLWQSYYQRRVHDAKRVKTAQNFIHLNLSLSLLLAFVVFVLGLETAKGSKGGCAFVAALLHYLFLCSFCWMLCEGVLLYLLLRVVFSEMSKKWWPFLLIGYVTPLPIVVITVGVRHQYYGVRDSCGDLLYCWLSVEEGTIFGFVAPMLAIILVNVFFLVLALQTLWKSRRGQIIRRHESEFKASQELGRALFVATMVLLPLLGLTWAFGLLTVNANSTAFAWLFTIFNSLQGMFIFFFHVIRSDKVWGKISPKLLILRSKVSWVSGSKWHDSTMTTGEMATTHSKTKSTETSTLPRDKNWILLGKGRQFYNTSELSPSMADSLNSPSNYELKSHVTNEPGTETKIDLGTIENVVDASLAETYEGTTIVVHMTNVSDIESQNEEEHQQVNSIAVESSASTKAEALITSESIGEQHTPGEQNKVETNQEMEAEKEGKAASNSGITDTKEGREKGVVIENPSVSKEEEIENVAEAGEVNSKVEGDSEVIENPTTALKGTLETKKKHEGKQHVQVETATEQSEQNTVL